MRSMKLLAAAALVAVLVDGPVLAQEEAAPVAAPSAATAAPAKATAHKKHSGKKHTHKKPAAPATAQ